MIPQNSLVWEFASIVFTSNNLDALSYWLWSTTGSGEKKEKASATMFCCPTRCAAHCVIRRDWQTRRRSQTLRSWAADLVPLCANWCTQPWSYCQSIPWLHATLGTSSSGGCSYNLLHIDHVDVKDRVGQGPDPHANPTTPSPILMYPWWLLPVWHWFERTCPPELVPVCPSLYKRG